MDNTCAVHLDTRGFMNIKHETGIKVSNLKVNMNILK